MNHHSTLKIQTAQPLRFVLYWTGLAIGILIEAFEQWRGVIWVNTLMRSSPGARPALLAFLLASVAKRADQSRALARQLAGGVVKK